MVGGGALQMVRSSQLPSPMGTYVMDGARSTLLQG